jgi:hypothetical protein
LIENNVINNFQLERQLSENRRDKETLKLPIEQSESELSSKIQSFKTLIKNTFKMCKKDSIFQPK